ncbi:MAG TPA: hypothetical protein VKT78_13390 [Fimbriimonadaceae bacterium]|nr:hypothetical protein [Fimbriimonadaceae bacterium]
MVADSSRLFELLAPDRAMQTLLAGTPGLPEAISWIEAADVSPEMRAALWLYVDELDQAHVIVQDIPSSTGSYLHAILHRREGDYSNSKYWFRRSGPHPLLELLPGYDPIRFVDQAEAAGSSNPAELVATQRSEWKAVFDYLAGGGR